MIRKLQLDNSRVWRSFFRKLLGPVSFVTYVLFVSGGSQYLNHTYSEFVAFWFFGVTFVIPVVGWMVRAMWRDAVDDVDRENEQIMKRLRD